MTETKHNKKVLFVELFSNPYKFFGNTSQIQVKDIINPYNCLLKNANFSIKASSE